MGPGGFGFDFGGLLNPMMPQMAPSWLASGPMMGDVAANPLMNPGMIATQAMAAGVPPPPLPTPPNMGTDISSSSPSLGESLGGGGVPLPRPRPPEAGPGANALTDPKGGMNPLLDMLKGVKAPTPPAPQKVATPSAPARPPAIKSGEFMALLQMLGMTPDGGGGGLKLPSTLGAALGGR